MELKPISIDPSACPPAIHPYITNVKTYDSSCSQAARVIRIEGDVCLYLKSAPKGSLAAEAAMTGFFHEKGLSARVLLYCSAGEDWLLTEALPGSDCLAAAYLAQPERLCDVLAEALRRLHATDPAGCPVPDLTTAYLRDAERAYREGRYDRSRFPGNWDFDTPEDAYAVIQSKGYLLRTDTLLHGDCCLPNILLHNWEFSGMIDLGQGGVGDRHVDLHWVLWSLWFNLKSDRYRDRFLDAYGRDRVDEELMRVAAAVEAFG